jgi:hypothetical protein
VKHAFFEFVKGFAFSIIAIAALPILVAKEFIENLQSYL